MKLNEAPPQPKKGANEDREPRRSRVMGRGGAVETRGSRFQVRIQFGQREKKGVRLTLSNDPHNTSRHGGDAYESEAF